MPALRQVSRGFLASGGPTSGASPTRNALTFDLDHSTGAGQVLLLELLRAHVLCEVMRLASLRFSCDLERVT